MKEMINIRQKLLSLILAAALTMGTISGGLLTASAAGETATGSFAQSFADPSAAQSMKVRTWWPSADIDPEMIWQEVKEIKQAGFGCIELIGITEGYLSDAVDAERYGWSSEGWNDSVEVLIEAAEHYGISVDLTIGPRWPAGVPGLDLNSDASSKKLAASTTHFTVDGQPQNSFAIPSAPANAASDPQLVTIVVAQTSGTLEGASEYGIDETTLQVIDDAAIDLQNGTFSWTPGEQGEWTIFAYYSVATGQTSGDTSPTAYVIDHFSLEGTQAILDYWDNHMMTDEIREHFAQYGGNMFEDSLELTGVDLPWSTALESYFTQNLGYDIKQYLPLIMGQFSVRGGSNEKYTVADSKMQEELFSDYFNNLSDMYIENHIKVVQEWCAGHNIKYRAQAQGTSDNGWVDSIEAASYLDVAEGESLGMAKCPDSFRSLAGAANMGGTELVSVELGATFGGSYQVTWQMLLELLNRTASAGANQFVLHGFPTQSQQCSKNKWPGWQPFDDPKFSEAWNNRQPSWDYMKEGFVDYVSRLQTFLQYGSADVDFAVYRADLGIRTDEGYTKGVLYLDGNVPGDNPVTDRGYSYNYISPGNFALDTAVVENGVFNPDYAGYRALVINNEQSMELSAAQQILTYAKAGLPIILVGTTPLKDGTYSTDADNEVQAIFAELSALSTTVSIAEEDDLPAALAQLEILPSVRYSSPVKLAAQHRVSDKADLYYLYNHSTSDDYASNDIYHDDAAAITTTLTLEGTGQPYSLNPWTGEITPILAYTDNGNGTISLDVTVQDSEVLLIGITSDATLFGEFDLVSAANNSGVGQLLYEDGRVVYRTTEPTSYDVTVGGETITGSVDEVASPFALNDWTLTVTSYEPGDNAQNDVYDTKKVELGPYSLNGLTDWSQIEGLENSSGQGLYTATFTVEGDCDGALLDLGATYDNILEVTLNGSVLPNVDQYNPTLDLGRFLTEGENTLTVRTGTTLAKAVRASGGYANARDAYASFPTTYGLLGGVTVTPYRDVVVSVPEDQQADKSILNKVIAYAEEEAESEAFDNVIQDVQVSFAAALKDAQIVAANIGATQQEVDAAWQSLMTEIHKLGFVRGDKTGLGELIELANSFNAQIDRYTPATAQPFVEALADANTVYADGNAMQEDVETAESTLLNAMMNLRYRADKSVLEAVLAQAAELDTTAFTAQSVATFNTANEEAKAVYGNENAQQEEVNAAADNLSAAIDSLVVVGAETEGETVRGDIAMTTASGNAKTGDSAPAAVAFALLALACTGFVWNKKKK